MKTTRKLRVKIVATIDFDRDLTSIPFGRDEEHRQQLADMIAEFITERAAGSLSPVPVDIDTSLHFPRSTRRR